MVKKKVDGAKGTIVADNDERFAFFYNEDNRIVYIKPKFPTFFPLNFAPMASQQSSNKINLFF